MSFFIQFHGVRESLPGWGEKGESTLRLPLSLFSFLSPKYMNNYALRFSLPYADLSGVIAKYAEICEKIIVYEHERDDKVKKTHIHLLIIGCSKKDEALRRLAQKTLTDIRMTGNEFWKWSVKEDHKTQLANDPLSFITYMAKGKLAPKFVNNISPAEVEQRRVLWVDHKVPAAPVKYDEYEELKKDLMKHHCYENMTLDQVRSWTIHWYWKRDGKMPHISSYKRNACSLYMIAHKHNEISAIEEIKNLWY